MPKKSPKNWKVRLDQKSFDAVLTRYSKQGKPELEVLFEWKVIGRRREVVCVCIRSAGLMSALTASDIRSIPFSLLETMERQMKAESDIRGKQSEFKSGPHSGKPLTSDELRNVADLYREARNLGTSTARHISSHLQISESAVAKRISAARKAGLLGESLGTKAGEGIVRTKGTKVKK